MEAPQSPPNLHIPASENTVEVYAIDNGSRIKINANYLLVPEVGAQTHIHFPSYCFLIQHLSGRKILYDLSIKKDLNDAPRVVLEQIQVSKAEISVTEDVIQVLNKHGVRGEEVEAVIWSHFHFDHTGNMGSFPSSTDLVVGPGFKEKLLPGFPTQQRSPILESDYADRNLCEIRFDQGLKIGRFNAYDYFGDGSFYLLDTPGHSIGHMCALARTTAHTAGEDTFVFLGGDCAHHCGEFRPTQYLPLPAQVSTSEVGLESVRGTLEGKRFLDMHPLHSPVKPFYTCQPKTAYNLEDAEWSVQGMEEFDAHDNILTLAAHDETLLRPLQGYHYPEKLNEWRKQGLRKAVLWRFLGDFPEIRNAMAESKAA